MRTMKDSGVEWIGEIPFNWSIMPNKRVMRKVKCICDKYNNENVLSLTMNGVVVRDLENPSGKMPLTFDGYQYIEKGNLLMCLFDIDVTPRCVGVINENGVTSPAYSQFEMLAGNSLHYFYYYYLNLDYTKELLHLAKNLRHSLTESQLGEVCVPVPPISEQHRIVAYLDAKCAKIDALIVKQQEIIEKLKAYKLSVITEAVTKGLNPNVPMKDSGVDFMGKIPGHWEMVRMKFLLSHIIDCPHETPEYSADGEYLVIRTADQDFGFLRPDENMYRLNENEYQNRIRRLPLDKDDIVYGREGERWGLACLVPESNRYCLGQRMMQFRCNKDVILPAYAMWALNSRYVYLQGSVDTIGSTSPHVNISTMRNYNIPIPPLDEQQEIVRYINEKAAAIEKTIQKRTMLIDKMNAYKKSLIYEVVIGKREV